MGVICYVSFSSEYINFSSPAGREDKQVRKKHLIRKTNELAPLHPFQSLQNSSFITCLRTLTALECLSQVFLRAVLILQIVNFSQDQRKLLLTVRLWLPV